MKLCKFLVLMLGLLLTAAAPGQAQVIGNADDGTVLKQFIIFGRHSVRGPTVDMTDLSAFAVDPYPDFGVPTGHLTPHGRQAESLLGSYYRAYLLHEGLFTGNARTDAARSYCHANSIERSVVTAKSLEAALVPGVTVPVHSYPLGTPDPIFDPIKAGLVKVNFSRAVTEVEGIYNNGGVLASSLSAEYSLIRSVLFGYPQGTDPPPKTPLGYQDATTVPVTLTANTKNAETGSVIELGGLTLVDALAGPFLMEYADGFPLDEVAWGRLTPEAISQATRPAILIFDIEVRSPYLAQLQSSNAASHVLRTMEQAVTGKNMNGAFGNAKSRAVAVISSDTYVAGLAGLLGLHWVMPGYQRDFCSPGGALVFELRQSKKTKEHLVRVYYTSQTLDQLRNLTPLTLDNPPATMQLTVPGGSTSSKSLDVPYTTFRTLVNKAVNPKYVQDAAGEVPPGAITDASL